VRRLWEGGVEKIAEHCATGAYGDPHKKKERPRWPDTSRANGKREILWKKDSTE